jgi:hypothetical protein
MRLVGFPGSAGRVLRVAGFALSAESTLGAAEKRVPALRAYRKVVGMVAERGSEDVVEPSRRRRERQVARRMNG